jgi:cell wall-associated NlpC family hydrolase
MLRRNAKLRLLAVTLGVVLGALVTAATAVAEPAEITSKRAEAEAVLAQIAELDINLEEAVEAWNAANLRLDELQAEIERNQRHLEIAKTAYRHAQKNLQERLVALYVNGEQSTLEIILGASSLDELLDRIDSAERISDEDARIVDEVKKQRAEIKQRERKLEKARAEQRQVVADRAERRASIESQLAERQELYSSIEDEIAQLVAEEEERQRQLAAERRRQAEEAERIAAAAAAAGVDTSVVVATPEGIGTAPPSSYGGDVVSIAMQYLGVPYVWGGASPSGFDCSGLVVYVFAQAGRPGLPHYTGALWQMGVAVSYGSLQPGDLVFFYGGGHMGIYIGGGQFIHAPHTGDVVKISDMSPGSSYAGSFIGARRI